MRVCQFRHFGIGKAPGENPARRRETTHLFYRLVCVCQNLGNHLAARNHSDERSHRATPHAAFFSSPFECAGSKSVSTATLAMASDCKRKNRFSLSSSNARNRGIEAVIVERPRSIFLRDAKLILGWSAPGKSVVAAIPASAAPHAREAMAARRFFFQKKTAPIRNSAAIP